MTRKDSLTLRFCALMLALIAIELSMLVIVDPANLVATLFLAVDVVAVIGFAVSFVQEDSREQASIRAADRRRNDSEDLL